MFSAGLYLAQRPLKPSRKDLELLGKLINNERYRVIGYLGHGANDAVIYRVADIDGSEYAVKRTIENALVSEGWALEEGPVIHSLVQGHPNVLSYHQSFYENGYNYLVTDVCEGGSLASFVEEGDFFWRRDDRVGGVFSQLMAAMSHCHSRGVALRDVDPRGILAVDADGKVFCLAGFDRATRERRSSQFGLGQKEYLAPECLGDDDTVSDYDTCAADVWSLGILLVYMLTGAVPWPAASTSSPRYATYLHDRAHLQTYLPLADELMPLLVRVLEPRSEKRIALSQLEAELGSVGRLTMDDAGLARKDRKLAKNSVEVRARMPEVEWVSPAPLVAVPPRLPDSIPHSDVPPSQKASSLHTQPSTEISKDKRPISWRWQKLRGWLSRTGS